MLAARNKKAYPAQGKWYNLWMYFTYMILLMVSTIETLDCK
ncbi:MAG: hypothetical protein ACK57M_02030 [Rickettsiales bacterium]|jgi:hypothetical protein